MNPLNPHISRSSLDPQVGFDYQLALKIRNSGTYQYDNGAVVTQPDIFGPFGKFQDLECEVHDNHIIWELRQGLANNHVFRRVFDFDMNQWKVGGELWVPDSPLFYILYEQNEYYAILNACITTSVRIGIMPGRRVAIVSMKGVALSAYCIKKHNE